uniref:Ig-like domain-containing protein n=1 Tax=Erpetoichthys calabaricus TaxID=27687 RepID=A0A8C4XAB9_ERPCA
MFFLISSDASGQRVLTQSAVTYMNLGSTVTLDCNIEKDEGNNISWLKQVPGSPPQHILYFYHSWSSPTDYGTGFSSSRFTSKAQGKTDYQLIISNAEASDSAIYFCQTWDDSSRSRLDTVVFGKGTRLIISEANLPPPSVTIIPQVPENLADSDTVTLVCIANKLSVSLADLKWTSDGTEVTSNTYSISSYLSITGREWKADKVYVCTASQGSTVSALWWS